MRTVALVALSFVLASGCTNLAGRESFDLREKVAEVSAGSIQYALFERSVGYGYWVPLQDVTRTRVTSFVVEIESNDVATGIKRILKADLTKLGLKPERPPGFAGATERSAFWGSGDEYFVVDLATAKVTRITCEPRFLSPGKWEVVDDQTIRRVTDSGVFELSVDGAREVKITSANRMP